MITAATAFVYDEMPHPPTIPATLAATVARHADNDFVVSSVGDGSDERVTYHQAEARSAEMAARLIAAGVTKGVRVGILAPNGPDFVVAFLAITRIGAVAVPINTFFQPPELRWLLRDADVHTVLAVPELLGKDVLARIDEAVGGLTEVGTGLRLEAAPSLRNVLPLVDVARTWPASWPEPVPDDFRAATEATVRPSDDLLIVYTSGSTADPKGIIHTHGAAITHSRFIATAHAWDPSDRVYVPNAFFWVGGLVYGVLGPMQVGVTIVTEHRFEPGDVLRLLASERVTYAMGFPHVGPALLAHPDFPDTDLSSLREGYQQALLGPDRRTPDPSLRASQLGMTETCSSHTWWPPHEQVSEAKRGSMGVSGPGFQHKIIDDDGAEVGPDTVGEICVRGKALMRGVVGRLWSEVTDADGWYHTGDRGYSDDDGHIYFGGRSDDMIKTSGANVAPIEVEAALGRLDEVRIAYVTGVPDPDRGAVVSAVVVLNKGKRVTAHDLSAACKPILAAYKIPKKWIILDDADRLPYTTTNKIDKRRLSVLVASGGLT